MTTRGEIAERFSMAMAEAGFPHQVFALGDGLYTGEFPSEITMEHVRAGHRAILLADPEGEWLAYPDFDAWLAAFHRANPGVKVVGE